MKLLHISPPTYYKNQAYYNIIKRFTLAKFGTKSHGIEYKFLNCYLEIVKKSVSLKVNTLYFCACNISSFLKFLHPFNVHICFWIIYHAMYIECTFFVYNQALQKKVYCHIALVVRMWGQKRLCYCSPIP